MDQASTLVIQTGARLHFGLLATREPFGGLGTMVDAPGTTITFRTGERFRADGGLADRARPIARRVAERLALSGLPPIDIRCNATAPAHHGFGSGTQISLTIAEGLCRLCGLDCTPEDLAGNIADRGKRSAVGIHGYFSGGLIFEDADAGTNEINSIRCRVELPESWRVVLVCPRSSQPTTHGSTEKQKFASLPSQPSRGDELRDLLSHDVIPAAQSGTFAAFADAIEAYNRSSGLLFESVQGGPYNGSLVTDLVEQLRASGAKGVGQSSWGPGVFCWCASDDEAERLRDKFTGKDYECQITRVRNEGRTITEEPLRCDAG